MQETGGDPYGIVAEDLNDSNLYPFVVQRRRWQVPDGMESEYFTPARLHNVFMKSWHALNGSP